MTEENNIDPQLVEELAAVIENDAVAVEIPAQPEPAAVVEESTPEPAPVVEESKPKPATSKKNPANVASGKDRDDVVLANCTYKNKFAKKSLTVHHLQRRLNELGYKDAYSDKDGWFGDLTRLSVEAFQKDKGLPVTGDMDADTFKKIFEGDPHVNVII